jgi:hypothetical protein
MKFLGQINNRHIIYLEYDPYSEWVKYIPDSNWLLFVITDQKNVELFDEINGIVIDKNVVYVCSAGKECEFFHDRFDGEIVIRDIDNLFIPEFCIMTTWHYDFDEGFWFAIYCAIGESELIDKIVCLDLTNTNNYKKLQELIVKMSLGWLPD